MELFVTKCSQRHTSCIENEKKQQPDNLLIKPKHTWKQTFVSAVFLKGTWAQFVRFQMQEKLNIHEVSHKAAMQLLQQEYSSVWWVIRIFKRWATERVWRNQPNTVELWVGSKGVGGNKSLGCLCQRTDSSSFILGIYLTHNQSLTLTVGLRQFWKHWTFL